MDAFDLAIRERFANVERGPEDMHSYQDECVAFGLANPFSAFFIDMGLGKTVSSLTIIARLLLETFDDDMTLVIGPLRVVTDTWPTEIELWRHTAWMSHTLIRNDGDVTKEELAQRRTSVHFINREQVEWLVYFWKEKWPYRRVFVDECFVGTTLVSTPTGDVPIADLRAGNLVDTPYGAQKIQQVILKSTTSIIVVTLADGRCIRCTPNHRFLTDAGWKPASELLDRIVYGQSDIETEGLRTLRRDVLDMEVSPAVLQPFLRTQSVVGERHDGARPGNCQEGVSVPAGIYTVEQGCSVAVRNPQEDGRAKPRSIHGDPRWERSGDEQVGSDCESASVGRLGLQLRDSCGNGTTQWLPDSLQDRFCVAPPEDGFGSGRIEPLVPCEAGTRPPQGSLAVGTRVVSVSSDQCASGCEVYDLTVEGAPYYFAAGALVHNCSSFKDHTSKRFKALAKVRNTPGLITRLHILTATPAAETYIHLFPQMYLLDLGKRLGKNITAYREEYFVYNKYSMKYKLRPSGEEAILAKIADICLVQKAKDHLSRAEPTIIQRKVGLDPAQLALIKKLEKDFVVTLADGTEIEAKTAAILSSMLLQMASGSLYETLLLEDFETDDLKKVKKVHNIHDHKIEALKEIYEEAQAQGEPLLVAYYFQSSLAKLRKAFPKATVMDKDGKCIKPWNAGKIPMLLIHPQSAGHGLNLQRGPGHTLIFFDLLYSLEYHLQTIGRIDRQGQANPVIVQLLIAEGTRDQDVANALVQKQDAQEMLFVILKRLIRAMRKAARAIDNAIQSSRAARTVDVLCESDTSDEL